MSRFFKQIKSVGFGSGILSGAAGILALSAFAGQPASPPRSSGFRSAPPGGSTSLEEPKDSFDHLDGKGPSRVNVTAGDWQGNFEIHACPKGSLRGLGMAIDHKQKGQDPVLVTEYKFFSVPYTMIRRPLLLVPLTDSFKVFSVNDDKDCDHIIVSNNTVADATPYRVVKPRAMFPDHYGEPDDSPQTAVAGNGGSGNGAGAGGNGGFTNGGGSNNPDAGFGAAGGARGAQNYGNSNYGNSNYNGSANAANLDPNGYAPQRPNVQRPVQADAGPRPAAYRQPQGPIAIPVNERPINTLEGEGQGDAPQIKEFDD